MGRDKAFLGMMVCLFVLIAVCLISIAADGTDSIVTYILMLVPMAGVAVFAFHNRCPHCGYNLCRQPLYAEYCPHCGEHL